MVGPFFNMFVVTITCSLVFKNSIQTWDTSSCQCSACRWPFICKMFMLFHIFIFCL